MKFGLWDIPEKEYVSECAAYERAVKISASDIRLDLENRRSFTTGSAAEPYETTLEGCTCEIHNINGLPCKHMIRLAAELGYSFDVPEFDPYAAADYDISEDVERLTARWRSGQLTLEALRSCIAALKKSASKSKRRKGRPKKEDVSNAE